MKKKGKFGCCSSFLFIIIAIIALGAIGGSGGKENKSVNIEKETEVTKANNQERNMAEEAVSIVSDIETPALAIEKESSVGENAEADLAEITVFSEEENTINDKENKAESSKVDTNTDSENTVSDEEKFEPIQRGNTGDSVIEIQTKLAELGLLASAADGHFGSGTERAVKDFQIANQLEASGIVDKTTYDAIVSAEVKEQEPASFSLVKRGDKGDSIIEIQKQLVFLGYLTSSADGNFGSGTEQAVKDFQNANRLKVTGIVDESTYNKMFSSDAKHYVVPIVPINNEENSENVGTRNSSNFIDPDVSDDDSSIMVWLSATGDKYHSINHCGRMDPSKAHQVTLEYAESKGYGPCSKCW